MTCLRDAIVDDNSLEGVLVVVGIELSLVVDAPSGVGKNVEDFRKLAIGVELELFHGLKVKLETLESEYEHLWECLQTHSFYCLHLTITFLAEIGILTLQHFSLYELPKGFLQIFLVLDLQSNAQERLDSF